MDRIARRNFLLPARALATVGLLLALPVFAQTVPTLIAITRTSPATISPGFKVVYAVTVKAGASPLDSVSLALSDSTGGHHSTFVSNLAVPAGTTRTVTVELPVGTSWLNGEHRILLLALADIAARQSTYRYSGQVETMPEAEAGALSPHALRFSDVTFSVSGGLAALAMPRLTSVTRSSPRNVRAGDTLDLRLGITPGNRGLNQGLMAILDPAGNTRWIGYSGTLESDPTQTRVDSSWINGTYRVQYIHLTDQDFRTVAYERNGSMTFYPSEAGMAGTHSVDLASLDFEVTQNVDTLVPPTVLAASRVSPGVAYPDDFATFEVTVQPGTARLTSMGITLVDPSGLNRGISPLNPVLDANNRVRLMISLSPAWPRGRYRLTSITVIPEVGWSRTYLRSGQVDSVMGEPPNTHTLNLPSLDFDYEDRPIPPQITEFSSGIRSYVLGASPVFTVSATGTGPLTYLWRKDRQPIPGAVFTTLTLTNFQASQAGVYDVVVSNVAGTVIASPPLIVLVANPSITRQPSSALTPEGNGVMLAVEAAGSSLTYEWYEGLAGDRSYPLSNSSRPTLTVPASLQTRSFWVRVSNFAGEVFSDAVLVPPQSMLVIRQPGAWTTSTGNLGLYSFRIKVMGQTGALSLRVRKDGVDVTTQFIELERTVVELTENQRQYTEVDFRLQTGPLAATDSGNYQFEVLLGGVVQPLLTTQTAALFLTSSGVPRVLTDPVSQRVRRGETVTLSVQAVGSGPLSYQWRRNRIQIAGATQASLVLAGTGELTVGQYDVIVSSATGAVVSSAAAVTLNTDYARLTNLSVRGFVLGRSRPLIAGLVIRDSLGQGLPLVIRGVGPTLGIFGISSAMRDPEVVTYGSSGLKLAENNDWGGGATLTTAFARVGAFAFVEPTSRDAAMIQTPGAGALTVHVNNRVEEGGSGMIEVYDDSDPVGWENERSPRLVNLSTRVQLVTGQTVIAGFAVGGNRPLRLLVRGAGPALRAFGVSQAMDDPRLTVYRSDGTVIAANDDWGLGTASAEVAAAARTTGAFDFAPGSQDAALLLDLPPGTATVHLTGSAGEALIELYVVE
ncbi:MAG: hypothetical protein JNN01_26770 [Opitutaceae bacterium]|nr:hypothetical protein [Opitutaceae bacterium]